jgi:hypothetical protein
MVSIATSPGIQISSSVAAILGTRLYARLFGLALSYTASHWGPPVNGNWRKYHAWDGLWCRDDFPQHVVVRRPGHILVARTSTGMPDWGRAEELGRLALGPEVVPVGGGVFPLALRVPMLATEAVPQLPPGDFRCVRVVPGEHEAAHLVRIAGVDAEIRVAATRKKGEVQFFGEVFPCGAHETNDFGDGHRVRHTIFPHDAERVLDMPDSSQEVISHALQQLFAFCWSPGQFGWKIDPEQRLPGWKLGRVGRRFGRLGASVRLPPDVGVGPLWVDLELPGPAGKAAEAVKTAEKKYPALLLEAMHYGERSRSSRD